MPKHRAAKFEQYWDRPGRYRGRNANGNPHHRDGFENMNKSKKRLHAEIERLYKKMAELEDKADNWDELQKQNKTGEVVVLTRQQYDELLRKANVINALPYRHRRDVLHLLNKAENSRQRRHNKRERQARRHQEMLALRAFFTAKNQIDFSITR